MPWEMLPPEVFVVVSSLALCGVLLLLTVLTQLQVDSRQRVWRALRVAVGSYLRPRGRTGSDAAAVSSVGKPPGKRARRTERRRQRRAVMSGGTNDELNLRRQAEPQTSSQNSVHAETTAAKARETLLHHVPTLHSYITSLHYAPTSCPYITFTRYCPLSKLYQILSCAQ